MEKTTFNSPNNRLTVFKTENGIEIKPMLHQKTKDSKSSTNISYYYVLYRNNNDVWIVYTNPTLYGENKIINEFTTEEEAQKTAEAINKSMHLLFENINI